MTNKQRLECVREMDAKKARNMVLTRKADAQRAAGASPAALRGGRSWVTTQNTKEEKKMGNWYAVQNENDRFDGEWGTGTFDWQEAVKMAKETQEIYGGKSYIAEIDGGYDANGEPTTDPICVAEYVIGIDF